MENAAKFYEMVRNIYQLACKHGINSLGETFTLDSIDLKKFVEECHIGFKRAQDLIIDALIVIEKRKRENENDLKEARRSKNEKRVKAGIELASTLAYREKVIRNLTNSIAWQMIHGHHHIIRRLFLDQNQPSLISDGFLEAKKEVERLNKGHESFALLADLTSFIQIGDIFLYSEGEYQIIEVKSGSKNEEAKEILRILNEKAGEESKIEYLNNFKPKMQEQVKRMQRQIKRTNIATSAIKNEKGIDPRTGADFSVYEVSNSPDDYLSTLCELIKQSTVKQLAYAVVEEIVHIGVYQGIFRYGEGKLIEGIMKRRTGKNIPVYSYIHTTLHMICEPIFLKNISENDIFNLITGNVTIYISIDYDKLIELIASLGYKAKWATTSETQKMRESHNFKNYIIVENKALIIDHGDEKYSFLGDGIIARMVADNLLPSVVIKSLIESIENNEVLDKKNASS